MAEGSDHTQPSGTSREQILRDLEAAGLLRLLDAKPSLRRAALDRKGDMVPPMDGLRMQGSSRKRRLLLALCGLAVAMAALACLLVLSMASGGGLGGR